MPEERSTRDDVAAVVRAILARSREAAGGGIEVVGAGVDDAVRALDVELTAEDLELLEEAYRPHELVGLIPRPGKRTLAGSTATRVPDLR